jgi:acetolactate synthase I/II/III large subunit
MMGVGDVATAAREKLPVIVAVLNDEKYGMVEAGHQAAYGRHPEYASGPVDIAALARSIGAESAVIEKPNQLRELGLAKRSRTVPMVLDIRIDRSIRIARARVDFIKDATQKASN